ncbi:hypothetical protein B0H16DRAFT_404518 [Mycena metata]|uniref:Uncharacterized protein n=1 Tax=Mycena metata TaxID=1033252 RepID=A0AAD7HG94_9AGAR|nr:hypothetical protein B0H16DRAFT_404518 [Mycena metata]
MTLCRKPDPKYHRFYRCTPRCCRPSGCRPSQCRVCRPQDLRGCNQPAPHPAVANPWANTHPRLTTGRSHDFQDWNQSVRRPRINLTARATLGHRDPVSTRHPRASHSPVSSKRASHHRKFSYDIPVSCLLSSRPSQNKRSSYFPDECHVKRHGILNPAGAERSPDELQVELETAASATLYEKEEPEMPLKPPRRRPLRTRSEPRPPSSEFGSAEGHELGKQIDIQQHPSVDGSGSLANAESNEPQTTAATTV